MPIEKKRLHVGKSYRIELVSDASTTDPSLLIRGWVPISTAPAPPPPRALSADPGSGDSDDGKVPECHALDLVWDVPDDPGTSVRIRVLEAGAVIVDRVESADGWLTVIVRKS